MATKTTKTRTRSEISWNKVINFFAYVALIFVAVAVVIGKAIPKVAVLFDIGAAIAIIVTSIFAYKYARAKRNVWFLVIWAVALVAVIVGYVLGAVL